MGSVHPGGGVSAAGGEPGSLGQLCERSIIVAHWHFESCVHVPFGVLDCPGPHQVWMQPRRPGDDDWVALPGLIDPARQEDSGNRPFLVDPEELLDFVGLSRLAPPPLHVGGFPEAGVMVS
jgi:hypothetical protein